MEYFNLGIIVFLFILAAIDLMVGVSNDAVNFLNSAVGSKVARFRTILLVATVGVFIGATTSNGMMDIARHGIFQPAMFSYHELLCIFLAVMVTDVLVLDIFNTLGMPTSTTISIVFELLGGTFILALLKIMADSSGLLTFGNLLNTEKALSVILGIFLSVAVAFIVGSLVQWVARLIFTFNYQRKLKWTVGIFGGVACTALSYFILISGLKAATFVSPDFKEWVNGNTGAVLGICFVFFTLLMQLLHAFRVNVFKVIVLLGTFALALAFAGNDLVNFIGVPLAGYSSYVDFTANAQGAGMDQFLMSSLESSAQTPWYFLVGAGCVMVFALATSKKAHNVIKTSVNLARQEEGDEMFGSSAMARLIVRRSSSLGETIQRITPKPIIKWIDGRFNKSEVILANGASFDVVRAAVNLVLSAVLIVFGTNMKLPLSTTYVTFIVAMGTSLADRAWSRESAVYRITGVLSVIGGWFITAFVAFTACAIVTILMYYGGMIVMVVFAVLAMLLLVRSQLAYKNKVEDKNNDVFQKLLVEKDKEKVWSYLKEYTNETQITTLQFMEDAYGDFSTSLCRNDLKLMKKVDKRLRLHKDFLKKSRQRGMVGLRRTNRDIALEYNTWFHLMFNSSQQLMYCLRRMIDPSKEHLENNFTPLSNEHQMTIIEMSRDVENLTADVRNNVQQNDFEDKEQLLLAIDASKRKVSLLRKRYLDLMHTETGSIKASLIYLNWLQETQQYLSSLRQLLNALSKLV